MDNKSTTKSRAGKTAKKAAAAAELKNIGSEKARASTASIKTRNSNTVGVENSTTSNILRIVSIVVPQSDKGLGLNVLFHEGLRNSTADRKSPRHAYVHIKWADIRSTYCTEQYAVCKDGNGVAVCADLTRVDDSKMVSLTKWIKENADSVTPQNTDAKDAILIDEDIFVYCKNIYSGTNATTTAENAEPTNIVNDEGVVVEKNVYIKNEVTGFSDVSSVKEADESYTEMYEVAVL
jgi:hypothetical protein